MPKQYTAGTSCFLFDLSFCIIGSVSFTYQKFRFVMHIFNIVNITFRIYATVSLFYSAATRAIAALCPVITKVPP